MSIDLQITEPGGPGRSLPDRPIDKIGKYALRGEIGRGACGVVYRGFDPFVQREVAVKIALADRSAAATDGEAQRTFFSEARAAGMLQHPHIVALHDAGVDGEFSYLVMEYIDGTTLLPMCRSKGPRASLERIVDIAFRCAKALDYAHSRGVLHRDIKPGNIMVTRDGIPKLMDFSIAEIVGLRAPSQGPVVGSPLYMAPEQLRREALSPATDLYALGAVMFQLLTGEPPFPHTDMPALLQAIRGQPAPRLHSLRADIPDAICDIVDRLLRKDPTQRYASGGELAAALLRQFDQLRMANAQIARRESRDSLRRLHFFNAFSDEDIDEILNAATMTTYVPGQKIIEEGAVDNTCFILALGSAEVRKAGKLLHTVERGDCVGEFAFLSAVRRTASVIATTPVLALKINATVMEQASADCQLRFYKVFTQTLIYRLSLTSAKLSALS